MNVFKSKGVIRLFFIVRLILIIVITVGFFFFYNIFLVDRSLESLKFSLSTVAGAETVGSASYIAPLMQIQFIDELSSAELNTADLMRLQYSADVIGTSHQARKVADVASIMQEIINKKEKQRHIILRFFDKINSYLMILFKRAPAWRVKEVREINIDPAILAETNIYENIGNFDEAIKLYRDTVARFPDYAQTPALMLRLGYLLHKLGRFEEARLVYDEVISRFPTMTESKVARELIGKIEKTETLDKKAKEMISRITLTTDRKTKQKLYYELGMMELSVLNLQKAKGSFQRAISILPDTDVAAQSYLRLGICERLLGDLDASIGAFKKASDITKSAESKRQLKYQLAQSHRQKGEYKEAASALDEIAKEEEDKDIRSLLLFQEGSTLLYDEKDVSKAKEVFDELMRRYSAHALVSPGSETGFIDFVKKHVNVDILARRPEELEELLEKAWVEALLPKKILKIIEVNSTKVINSLNRTVEDIAKLKEPALKEGDYIQIELTEMEANNFIRDSVLSAERIEFSDMYIKFEGNQKLTISVTIRQTERPIKVSLAGELKAVKVASAPYWVSTTRQRNLLIFLAEKCKIGNVPVTPDIINPLLRPAFENFNESFPLDIEEFRLNENAITLAGPLRQDFIKKLKTATPATDQIPSKEAISGILKDISVKKLERKGG